MASSSSKPNGESAIWVSYKPDIGINTVEKTVACKASSIGKINKEYIKNNK